MSKIQTDHLLGTSSKILINDWPAMREIIAKTASTLKQKQETDVSSIDNLMSLVTDVQLNDATDGPYHTFINKLLWGYSIISKLRLRIIITSDDNLKPHIRDNTVDLPENIKKDVNAASLDKMQRQLDELAKTQFQQWQELVTSWEQQLVMQLTMNDVNLSELEIEQISKQETLSEILNLFNDLHLEPPRVKGDRIYFSDYLKLKTMLCIHSAFSRQHKPHAMIDIQKSLKLLKNDFKQVSQQEKELIETQHQEIDNLVQLNV